MDNVTDPLSALKDIHIPPDPVFWPPAPGWWIVSGAVIVLVWLAIKLLTEHLNRTRPGKEFRRQLMMLDAGKSNESKLTSLLKMSELVRQYAICRYGRSQVAKLHGNKWLEFLTNTTKGELDFTDGVARVLGDAMHQPEPDTHPEQLKVFLISWSKRA